jgi:hypothetical protein
MERRARSAAAIAFLAAIALAGGASASPTPSSKRDPYRITRSAVAGISIGDSSAAVRRLWGQPPTQVRRYPANRRLRRGEIEFWFPPYDVIFRGGRAISISLGLYGTIIETIRGDEFGTSVAVFRSHWPSARKVVPDLYYIAATPPGYILVFVFASFPAPPGLQSVTLISKHDLYSCVLAHGSC